MILKTYPGASPGEFEYAIDKNVKGVIIEGTGLGHAPHTWYSAFQRAQENKIPVVMTSQCLWGRINMNVYRTGVELQQLGVIPGHDMLPETAFVKLAWLLAQTKDLKEIKQLMHKDFAGEITPCSRSSEYPFEELE